MIFFVPSFKPYNLELGIAVGASAETASTSYDIPNIAKYVDFINIMTYDFATSWDGKLGFNAPLMGQGQNNVQSAVSYWLQQGMFQMILFDLLILFITFVLFYRCSG